MKSYKSSIIHAHADRTLELFVDAYLNVSSDGLIHSISKNIPIGSDIEDFSHGIILPGMIDLHTHLPQYEFASQGAESLMLWLAQYTFPQEMRFVDHKVAEAQSAIFFRQLLRNGTTTAFVYLTSQRSAAEIAFEAAAKSGIRAFLGLTLMDQNVPAALMTSAGQAENDCVYLVERYHKKSNLEFVVTPRFAVTCSSSLLSFCGEYSRAQQLYLQTHIGENLDEINEVKKLFPQATSYAEVYAEHGCLHERTLLAHGIYLQEDEICTIHSTNSALIHCPVSNRFLSSGIMPYKAYRDRKIKLGLGTDVAAGYSLSMIHEAREMIEMSKLRTASQVKISDAFYQATLGNAICIGQEDHFGNLTPGKKADFILVEDLLCNTDDLSSYNYYSDLFERLNRIFYRPHPDMISKTFVNGKCVYQRA